MSNYSIFVSAFVNALQFHYWVFANKFTKCFRITLHTQSFRKNLIVKRRQEPYEITRY